MRQLENTSQILSNSGVINGGNNNSIYYRIFGQGLPIIISNNFFMNADHWTPYISNIAEQYRVICYDLRDQGNSEFTNVDHISVEDHVSDLRALIDNLSLEMPILLGTCISTAFCKEFAVAYPEDISGLFLVGPVFSPFGDRQLKFLHKTVLRSLDHGGVGALFDHYYPILYSARSIHNNGTVGYLTLKQRFIANNPEPQLRRHLNTTMKRKDTAGSLERLNMPIHFIAGECDPLSDLSSMQILSDMASDATASLIPLAGHNPYLDSTSEFEDAVIQFANKVYSNAN